MLSQIGIEASRATQYVIAFAIILVLVALFGLVLRKLTGSRLMMNGQDRARARQPRLGVVDIYDLDRQRQLVLLRRDNVEHLLLIGGLNDVVIETNIVRVAGARIPAVLTDQGSEKVEPAVEQHRPQVETPGRPSIETQLAAQLGSFLKRPSDEPSAQAEPSHEIHVVPQRHEPAFVPQPAPSHRAASIDNLRSDPIFADLTAVPRAMPEPTPAPAPKVEPRHTYVPPVFQSRPTPQAPPPPPPVLQPEPPAPAEPHSVDRNTPDAAILSDMAKQLEEALKRPAIPAAEDRADLASVAIEDNPALEDDDDLLEPSRSMDEDAVAMAVVEETVVVETFPEVDEAEPEEELEPEPVAASEPEAPPPPPRPEKTPDPFSVEEIEAEFARLLGRPLDPARKG